MQARLSGWLGDGGDEPAPDETVVFRGGHRAWMESVSSELVRDQSRSGPSEHNGAARLSLHPESVSTGRLERSIEAATSALLKCQEPDGHWVFECEADSTTPAEYVLLRHYLAEPVDTVREAKIGNYLRRIQGAHGGWPLFHDGDFDMSASVE